MNDMRKTFIAAAIIALGMIVSSFLLSKLFIRINHEKEITVKGYAEQTVHSDVGKFHCSFNTRKRSLQEAFKEIQNERSIVLQYLQNKGFEENEIEILNINTREIFARDDEGNVTNDIEFYRASQAIQVTSNNVQLINDVSQQITELIREGIDIYGGSPEFYVTDLAKIKVALIARATENGFQRAQILAENSGGRVGSLSSARQGVFQITSPNSTQTSDYGIYDTSTIKKTVKAVITLQYNIE